MTKQLISQKVQNMDVSGVRKMFEMASKIKDPINLTLGLPDYDIPQNIKDVAIEHIKQGNNRYTPTAGIEELKVAIQNKLKQKNNINVKTSQILVTSSVSGALSAALTAILDKDDEVIMFDPYFVGYKQLVIQNDAKPVFVKLDNDYSINFETLKKSINKQTKAILINSPNNPTGYVMSKDEIIELANIARENNLLIISDEIYEDFVYEKGHFSIQSIYENVVTLNGFSKSCAMTGWRVGYATGPKEIINAMIKVQQFNYVCAPTPFQHAAIEAINTDISDKVVEYKEKRNLIYEGLKDKYSLNMPKGAFYAFIKYPCNAEEFVKKCLDNSLLIVPGNVFSEENTHFRISFATDIETLEKAIKILNKLA